MNKKYRVEFNTTGFYSGQGVWEVLDETAEIEAETAQEAIEYAIDYFVETGDDREAVEAYAWMACEILTDDNGKQMYDEYATPMYGEAEYRN